MSIWLEGIDLLNVIVHTIYVDRRIVSQRKRTNGLERDGERQRRKVIPTHMFGILHSAVCIHFYRVHASQYGPFEVADTCARDIDNRSPGLDPSGMSALPRKGSSCHNVNWTFLKWEKTHPDPFSSNTSMEFTSRPWWYGICCIYNNYFRI